MSEITDAKSNPNNELVLVERTELEKEADAKITQIDNVIDFANVAKHSVIVLKIGGDTGHKMRMHQAFVRFCQSKQDLFKEKQLTILFLEPGDSLEILTEQDMEKAGWVKKEQSLIVKPF